MYIWAGLLCIFSISLLIGFGYATINNTMTVYLEMIPLLIMLFIMLSIFIFILFIVIPSMLRSDSKTPLTEEEIEKREERGLMAFRIGGSVVCVAAMILLTIIVFAIQSASEGPIDPMLVFFPGMLITIVFVALCWIFDLRKITI